MNKNELSIALSKRVGTTQSESKLLLEGTISVLSEILAKQDKFIIINFGTFEVRLRKERKFFNPLKLKMMFAPKKIVVSFHSSKNFLDEVNNNG